jgi:hypothetical protein
MCKTGISLYSNPWHLWLCLPRQFPIFEVPRNTIRNCYTLTNISYSKSIFLYILMSFTLSIFCISLILLSNSDSSHLAEISTVIVPLGCITLIVPPSILLTDSIISVYTQNRRHKLELNVCMDRGIRIIVHMFHRCPVCTAITH